MINNKWSCVTFGRITNQDSFLLWLTMLLERLHRKRCSDCRHVSDEYWFIINAKLYNIILAINIWCQQGCLAFKSVYYPAWQVRHRCGMIRKSSRDWRNTVNQAANGKEPLLELFIIYVINVNVQLQRNISGSNVNHSRWEAVTHLSTVFRVSLRILEWRIYSYTYIVSTNFSFCWTHVKMNDIEQTR